MFGMTCFILLKRMFARAVIRVGGIGFIATAACLTTIAAIAYGIELTIVHSIEVLAIDGCASRGALRGGGALGVEEEFFHGGDALYEEERLLAVLAGGEGDGAGGETGRGGRADADAERQGVTTVLAAETAVIDVVIAGSEQAQGSNREDG